MQLIIENGWLLICFTTGLFLLIGFVMRVQGSRFCTLDVVVRKFSIMDLEFPSSPREITNIINGIYGLPEEKGTKTLRFLRAQLYTDFLFMPAAYGSIFIACIKVAEKMSSVGHGLFLVLAWLQVIAWALDVIENIYLLKKTQPNAIPSKRGAHKSYQWVVTSKWAIALTGCICSLSALLYFWLIGNYATQSLTYLVIVVAEVVAFILAGKFFMPEAECE